MNIRAKTNQFLRVHETILKDGFCDSASAYCERDQGHHLRLEIRGKPRVRERGEMNAGWAAIADNANAVLMNGKVDACFRECVEQSCKMIRARAADKEITRSDSS